MSDGGDDRTAAPASDPMGADRTPASEFPDDPAESSDPDPEDIYSDVRTVLRVTERGTLARDPDPESGHEH